LRGARVIANLFAGSTPVGKQDPGIPDPKHLVGRHLTSEAAPGARRRVDHATRARSADAPAAARGGSPTADSGPTADRTVAQSNQVTTAAGHGCDSEGEHGGSQGTHR
jgi:hypothetical protein